MRHTEFWERMEAAMGGPFSRHWAATHVLRSLEGRTVDQALADGVPPKAVWRAVHAELELPARER